MIQELLYTSAPKGLKAGSRGFCTVLCTTGMPAPIAAVLESLSGYRPVYPPGDPNVSQNPVVYSHLKMPLGGRRSDVLSRVADYGLDYSQRTNKIAHHLVVDPGHRPAVGPAWLLAQPEVIRREWDGELRVVSGDRTLPEGRSSLAVCQAWKSQTGDAGWAGVLAEAFLKNPENPAYIVFSPGMDLLPLIAEAISLLPPDRRWDVTFSTYFTKVPAGVLCNWRCVLADSPEAKESRRYVHSLRIDLTRPLGRAEGGDLVQAARTGRMPQGSESRSPFPSGTPALAGASASGPAVPPPGPGRIAPRRGRPPALERADRSGSSGKWIAALALLAALIGGGGYMAYSMSARKSEKPVVVETSPPAPKAAAPLIQTEFSLSNSTIPENNQPNDVVGEFELKPQNIVPHQFEIGENPFFRIDGNKLVAKVALDHEERAIHKIDVTLKGEGIVTRKETIDIEVENVLENPTALRLSQATVKDRTPNGTPVGTFAPVGPDTEEQNFDYTLNSDLVGFELRGNELITTQDINIHDYMDEPTETVFQDISVPFTCTAKDGDFKVSGEFTLTITHQKVDWPLLVYVNSETYPEAENRGPFIIREIDLDGRDPEKIRLDFGKFKGAPPGIEISEVHQTPPAKQISFWNETLKKGIPSLTASRNYAHDHKRHHPSIILKDNSVTWGHLGYVCGRFQDDATKDSSYVFFMKNPTVSQASEPEGSRPLHVLHFGSHHSSVVDRKDFLKQLRVRRVSISFDGVDAVQPETLVSWSAPQITEDMASIEDIRFDTTFDFIPMLDSLLQMYGRFLNEQLPRPDVSDWKDSPPTLSLKMHGFNSTYQQFDVSALLDREGRIDVTDQLTLSAIKLFLIDFPQKKKDENDAGGRKPLDIAATYPEFESLRKFIADLKKDDASFQFADASKAGERLEAISTLYKNLQDLENSLKHPKITEIILETRLPLGDETVAVPVLVYPPEAQAAQQDGE